ncbi:MAG: RNA polymerase sigma factor [Bacteroidetes bacterium]|nr:RNA polymerase sigma factor [Bacteroidota bacterium]
MAANIPDINQDLIGLCIRGDRVAQYRLYKQYSRTMYNLCLRMVPNKSEAEDILQDAFVKMFKELPSFLGQSTLGAWLRRIVINQCLNHIRKQKPVFVELDPQDVPEVPEQDVDFNDITADEIHQAILRLPEGARLVCLLHLLEGYRHSDIAVMLGISESTSKSQYRRAVGMLQESLMKRVYEKQV